MAKIRSMAMVAAGLWVAGCSMPYKEPRIVSRPPGQEAFPGLQQLAAASPGHRLDVVMVHGMCTHGAVWARGSIDALAAALRDGSAPVIEAFDVAGTKASIYRATLAAGRASVRVNAVVWSPMTARLKEQLCYDQSLKSSSCTASGHEEPAYAWERADLNRDLKDGLLDDCLADALIYQGRSRDAINEQMQKAIVAALGPTPSVHSFRAAAQERAPLVIITDSLGSKIAFDAIYKLVESADEASRAAGLRTLDRMAQVFMRANQLPMLALADQDIGPPPAMRAMPSGYPADPLAALLATRRARLPAAAAVHTRVIAFTDPNDLLSYVLVPATQIAPYDVVDVIVSNQQTYFGYVERPDTAHTSYEVNPSVVEMIVCGTSRAPCAQ